MDFHSLLFLTGRWGVPRAHRDTQGCALRLRTASQLLFPKVSSREQSRRLRRLGFPLSHNLHVGTRVNKMEERMKAVRKRKSWAMFNFYVYLRPSINCLYFIYASIIYLHTHVKILRDSGNPPLTILYLYILPIFSYSFLLQSVPPCKHWALFSCCPRFSWFRHLQMLPPPD